MAKAPSWRKIERALVELMQEYRLPLTADRGKTFVERVGPDLAWGDYAGWRLQRHPSLKENMISLH